MVLSISHRVLNPVAAVKEALKEYLNNQIPEPPQNTSFCIIWFTQKHKLLPFRTFVIFDHRTPPELQTAHTWNMGFLEDSFDTAQGNYLKTQDSLNLTAFHRKSIKLISDTDLSFRNCVYFNIFPFLVPFAIFIFNVLVYSLIPFFLFFPF